MSGRQIFRERSGQYNRLVKVSVAASPQILLRLARLALRAGESRQLVIDLPQPRHVWRLFSVHDAPLQLVMSRLPLMETVWKLRMDGASNPVYNEHLAAGESLGLFQHGNGLFHPSDSSKHRN